MIDLRLPSKGHRLRGMLPVLALFACFSTVAQRTNNITGSAHNQSRGQPAIGDQVILVRLDRGMQEEAHAKTGAQGAFTLPVQYPAKTYLVRVVHQGVAYDQRASAGDALSVQVFDAAPRVRGIIGSIEILRTGTNANLLHVSDLYEIKNESSPPLTQASGRTFEVYLPANAKMDSVLAAGPEKIGVLISAAVVPGEPGHYTVSFPLRPGATKFAFNYDLPYDGHAVFQTRRQYPLKQLAVMIPPSMKFSSGSPAFDILATGNSRYQVRAANQLKAGEGPGFELSGSGELPPLRDQDKPQAQSLSPAVPNPIGAAQVHAALPSLASIDSPSKQLQPPSQSLVLGGVTSVLLAACALLVWRERRARNFSAAKTVVPRIRQAKPPRAV
jgi:hypothetical protein